jgi:hypothetical protein
MYKVKDLDGKVKVYRNTQWNEWIVKVTGDKNGGWYYTDDKRDALDTAELIFKKVTAGTYNYSEATF